MNICDVTGVLTVAVTLIISLVIVVAISVTAVTVSSDGVITQVTGCFAAKLKSLSNQWSPQKLQNAGSHVKPVRQICYPRTLAACLAFILNKPRPTHVVNSIISCPLLFDSRVMCGILYFGSDNRYSR